MIKFQYNKTSLQALGEALKVREKALPTIKNKESALRMEVKNSKGEVKQLEKELEKKIQSYNSMFALWSEFDKSLLRVADVWLTDEGRRDEVFNLLQDINKNDFGQCIKEDGTYDYDELRKAYGTMPDFWVSAFTIAVDCSQKTMKVRFWENPDDIFEFSF